MADPFGDLEVTGHIVVPAEDLTWRFTGSGGPGGQHANTSNTRVELSIDLDTCRGIPAAVRSRLRERHGNTLSATGTRHRSQYQNRRDAMVGLAAQIRAALEAPRRRVATRPTPSARRRRMDDKSARSKIKRGRRRPPTDRDD